MQRPAQKSAKRCESCRPAGIASAACSRSQQIIDSFPAFSIHRQTTTASLVSVPAQLLLTDFSQQDYI
jgi:hypothetical protein